MAIGAVTPVGTGADLIHRGSSSDAPLRAIGILLPPLALVLKNWHYISIVLPYLALGIVALLALGWALGLVGLVLRGGFVIAVALYRFITACVEDC